MGTAMAKRLLTDGHRVSVFNRTASKAGELIEAGAIRATTPREAARESDIVLSFVTDSAAVRQIVTGMDGILAGLRQESVHCEMSTVAPREAAELARTYVEAGKRVIQAPALGSRRQIENGELLVFAGGNDADIALCEPLLTSVSKRVWRFPPQEHAAAMKLACNMMIGQMIAALGQSMVFLSESGVPPETFLDVLSESALSAPMYASKGRTVINRDFRASFTVTNAIKDLTLADSAGREVGASLLMNAAVRQLLIAAETGGWGGEDYSAVVKVLEELAGLNAPA
jgi:3-hydroxyisobutyrate dehydrogenase-like beta-hydroxyacid dehydrogenase